LHGASAGNDDEMSDEREPNIAAGFIAGAIAGVAGGAAKTLCEMIVPPRPPGREPPPGVLADNVTRAVAGTSLRHEQKESVANVLHWVFSIVSSAVYGAVVEIAPQARAGFGTAFGEFVWLSFHEIALPALGATPTLPDLPASEQANEFVSHAIFGATVEGVRGLVRACV
jgi:putative membrane protein